MTNAHDEWLDGLSEYLDGGGDEGWRADFGAHLAGCGECRAVLSDLQEIKRQAAELGETQPARDLWPGISQAIREGGRAGGRDSNVIELPVAAPPARRAPGVYLTVRQLIAASVVLVAVSAAATRWAGVGVAVRPGSGDPAVGVGDGVVAPVATGQSVAVDPPAELADELGQLELALAEASGRIDPNTLRIVQRNLGVIQRAIDESKRALELDPANEYLKAHLERAYREKADVLREAATLADWVS